MAALNSRRSVSLTVTCVASATTLASVRMYPSGLIMKPEPRFLEGKMPLAYGLGENCLKNWASGSCSLDAGGQSGIRPATCLPRAALMLTTVDPSRRASSEKSVTIPMDSMLGTVGVALTRVARGAGDG